MELTKIAESKALPPEMGPSKRSNSETRQTCVKLMMSCEIVTAHQWMYSPCFTLYFVLNHVCKEFASLPSTCQSKMLKHAKLTRGLHMTALIIHSGGTSIGHDPASNLYLL